MGRVRRVVLLGLVGLYLGGLGVLSGMLVERMRFDAERAAVLSRLAATEGRLHAHLMNLERRAEHRAHAAGR
jgi:hypothetical protein